jgi:hypothetical protein
LSADWDQSPTKKKNNNNNFPPMFTKLFLF